jgi:hypothetical protein
MWVAADIGGKSETLLGTWIQERRNRSPDNETRLEALRAVA